MYHHDDHDDHDDQIYGDPKNYIDDHTVEKFIEEKPEEEKKKFLEKLWGILNSKKKGGKSKRKRSSRRKRKTKRSRKHRKK
jgi:hypothetical protein